MKKTVLRLWMLMALPMLLGLASCAEHDNPVDPNPLAAQVKGMWYNIADTEGTLPEEFGGEGYTRVIEAMLLNEDGTGFGCSMFFNNESDLPVWMFGGFTEQGLAPFSYTTTTDGRITLRFDQENTNKEFADFFKKWSLNYADGIVNCSDGSQTFQMEKADEAMEAWLLSMFQQYAGGASADNYNINDEDFTPTTWREQEAIYIYDGTGKDVTDAKGRTGYTLVNMPWYKGDVLTNLPEGFCDDITPENGWEWVLNRCGSRTIVNCNFFAVYNKYTGTLRFFYYLPYGFNTGNDHVWQVSMTDHLAQQSVWRYGLPEDKTIMDKFKLALGQTGSGTFMEYVTPWVDYMSSDGLIVPNAGWWAFDLDLSQSRSDNIQSSDNIKLQMRSWNTGHVSLASTVAGNIDGSLRASFDLTKTTVSSAKGITESFSDIKNVGTGIFNTVKSAISGDWTAAMKAGISAAKNGYTLYGAMTKKTTTSVDTLAKGSMTGTVNLSMTGSIDTEGTLRGSAPTVGIASPTIYLKDFDLAHSHLGQGVWNLKTSPVVFLLHTQFANNNDYRPYFFDPNVQLVLNPEVFPDSEIEWVEVNPLCTGKASMQSMDNDYIRTAIFGLKSMSIDRTAYGTLPYGLDWYDTSNALRDFLYAREDKLGMEEKHCIMHNDKGKFYLATTEDIDGRGADGFALEPQYWNFCDWYREYQRYPLRIPFLEINVTVRVKMKDNKSPIVLSRNYLPEIKDYSESEFRQSINSRTYADKTKGHSGLYDYQMERIKLVLHYFNYNNSFMD